MGAIGLMAAFAAIGDSFLIVFVGIFLALVFEYPTRFVMAKTRMSRGLAATVTVIGRRRRGARARAVAARPARRLGARLPARPAGDGADSCRTRASSRGSATPASAGNVQDGAQQVAKTVPDAISAVLGVAGSFFSIFLAVVHDPLRLPVPAQRHRQSQALARERADAGRRRALARRVGAGDRRRSRAGRSASSSSRRSPARLRA